jgi:hypothetical protein
MRRVIPILVGTEAFRVKRSVARPKTSSRPALVETRRSSSGALLSGNEGGRRPTLGWPERLVALRKIGEACESAGADPSLITLAYPVASVQFRSDPARLVVRGHRESNENLVDLTRATVTNTRSFWQGSRERSRTTSDIVLETTLKHAMHVSTFRR